MCKGCAHAEACKAIGMPTSETPHKEACFQPFETERMRLTTERLDLLRTGFHDPAVAASALREAGAGANDFLPYSIRFADVPKNV